MTTNGMNAYGLREAKKILRVVRNEVKGENGIYAKGFRDALRHVEYDIQHQLDEIKSQVLSLEK